MAYYPRWLLHLAVPVAGTTAQKNAQEDGTNAVQWMMPVRQFRLERNDHTQADTLEVSVDWSVAGVDPRMLTDGTATFYIGTTDRGADFQPSLATLRFCGIMVRAARVLGGGKRQVHMTFHDYTALFLAEKPFVTAGVPDYSQTLSQAWARICDHVGYNRPDGSIQSVVATLRNVTTTPGAVPGLYFEGDARDVVLGTAVAQRFLGTPIAAEITDAWAVWQQCVGMLGFISYFRNDVCVVTTATDYYTETRAPRLIYGKNLSELEEDRDVKRALGGIILESFDPLTGTTLEAIWPTLGNTAVRKKHLGAKKKGPTEAQILRAEDRTVFSVPGITNPDQLLAIAKRVYAERSRQELVGRASTSEFFVPTANTAGAPGVPLATPEDFDLLSLDAGEVVQIEVDQAILNVILGLGSDEARIERLEQYGFAAEVARVLVANLAQFAMLSPKFLTRRVIAEGELTSEGGTFQIVIEFCNRINVDGSADGADDGSDDE